MNIPIVPDMIACLNDSTDAARQRISMVRLAPIEGNDEKITFTVDCRPYEGVLRGRNRTLCVGLGADSDRAIALRVYLDGDAKPL